MTINWPVTRRFLLVVSFFTIILQKFSFVKTLNSCMPVKICPIQKCELQEIINRDLTINEIANHYGKSIATISNWVTFYGLKKTKEQKNALRRRLSMRRYGVESPNSIQSVHQKQQAAWNRKTDIELEE